MTNSSSPVLQAFWKAHSFASLTALSLLAMAVLLFLAGEQELLRATRMGERRRTARVLAVAIYPLSALAFAVVINRFRHLGAPLHS